MQTRLVLGVYPGETLESLATDLNRYLRERLDVSASYPLEGNNVPFVNLFTGLIDSDRPYAWKLSNPYAWGEKLGDKGLIPQLFETTDSGDIIIPVSETCINSLSDSVGLALMDGFEKADIPRIGDQLFPIHIKIGQLEDMSRRDEIARNYFLLSETARCSGRVFHPTGFHVEVGNKK